MGGRACGREEEIAKKHITQMFERSADKLAKVALVLAIAGGTMMEGDFPFKIVKLKLSGQRV